MVALINDNRKIGILLTGAGSLFLVLGVLLLFDTKLLVMGNVLFISGLTLLIGARKTVSFFARREKWRGSVCFLGGALLVLFSWPMTGTIVELFGVINLFGNFFPIIVSFLRGVPVIGPILNLPVVARVVDSMSGALLPTSSERSR